MKRKENWVICRLIAATQRGLRGRGNIVYCVFTSYGEARGGEKMGGKFELQDDQN